MLDELTRLLGDHPNMGEIRGKGLMTIIEIVADRETKAKFDPSENLAGRLNAATRNNGIIVRGTNDGIAISPPLIITKEEVTVLAEAIDTSIREALTNRMVRQLGVGIVGVGVLGRQHAVNLANRIPSARLVAIADNRPAVAQSVADELGVTSGLHFSSRGRPTP